VCVGVWGWDCERIRRACTSRESQRVAGSCARGAGLSAERGRGTHSPAARAEGWQLKGVEGMDDAAQYQAEDIAPNAMARGAVHRLRLTRPVCQIWLTAVAHASRF
jgi:hypothetical protein